MTKTLDEAFAAIDDLLALVAAEEAAAEEAAEVAFADSGSFEDDYWAQFEVDQKAERECEHGHIRQQSACRGPVVQGPFGFGRA